MLFCKRSNRIQATDARICAAIGQRVFLFIVLLGFAQVGVADDTRAPTLKALQIEDPAKATEIQRATSATAATRSTENTETSPTGESAIRPSNTPSENMASSERGGSTSATLVPGLSPSQREPEARGTTAAPRPQTARIVPLQATQANEREEATLQPSTRLEAEQNRETNSARIELNSNVDFSVFDDDGDSQSEANQGRQLQRYGSLSGQSVAKPSVSVGRESEKKPLQQIVVLSKDMKEAESVRRFLAREGIGILNRRKLGNLGFVSSTFRFAEPHTNSSILDMLSVEFPDAVAEQNQRFSLLSEETQVSKKKRLGHLMVGLEFPTPCAIDAHIAMLDSKVSSDLAAELTDRLRTYESTKQQTPAHIHGTSIASLLISERRDFPGLVTKVTLHAVNVFYENEEGELSTQTDWLLSGLDVVAGLKPMPMVLNMSFGGSPSRLLDLALEKLSQNSALVAAAGNNGIEGAVYPASSEYVYGVGALSGRAQRLKSSNFGWGVDVFAPGEDIWVRNAEGDGFYAQGSSYAAPFFSAALLQVIAQHKSVTDYLDSLGTERQVSFDGLCKG